MRNKRALEAVVGILLAVALTGFLWSPAAHARRTEEQKRPEGKAVSTGNITGVRLSFKVDPRLVDATYGGDRWVSPPIYTGANAQDTVEARAQVIDANGKPTNISLDWIPSDPEMVAVSPSQGDRVKVIVRHAGKSKLKVAAPGLSKELLIEAKYVGTAIQVEITQPASEKSEGGAAPQDARKR